MSTVDELFGLSDDDAIKVIDAAIDGLAPTAETSTPYQPTGNLDADLYDTPTAAVEVDLDDTPGVDLSDIDAPIVVREPIEVVEVVEPEPVPVEVWKTAEGALIHRLASPVEVPDGSVIQVSPDHRRGIYLRSDGIPTYVLPHQEAGHAILRQIERVRDHDIDDRTLLPHWKRWIDQVGRGDAVWRRAGEIIRELIAMMGMAASEYIAEMTTPSR